MADEISVEVITEDKERILTCDCGENKKLAPDEAQTLYVTSPRAHRTWVVCKTTECHQKIQPKIAEVHDALLEKTAEIVAAPPLNDLDPTVEENA